MEPSPAELARRLAKRAETVCRRYLSNGCREGRYWRVGDVQNSPGRSLHVHLHGRSAGRWRDAATGEHGDLIDLIAAAERHGSLGATVREARDHLALEIAPCAYTSTSSTRDSSTAARRLFAMSRSISGTPAGAYLRGRALTVSSRTLRFHPACWYRPAPHETVDRDAWPAMIAAVTDLDGAITGVQRTWLDPGGAGKADIASPRRSLGLLYGHGVRFGAAADVLLAGEGVETTLSIRTVLPELSAIAALSAANLAGLLFPPGLRRLYVARDRDTAGEIAATALAERCYEAGVELIVLEPRHDDFNTDLVAHGPEALLRDVRRQLAPGDRPRFAG